MAIRITGFICVIIAGLAMIFWTESYVWPTSAVLLLSKPTRAIYVRSRYGMLSLWTQEISPPPPDGIAVALNRPFRMHVTNDAFTISSLFSTSFEPDWPRSDQGWGTVQDSRGSVSNNGVPYTFTLSVRRTGIPWWAVGVIASIVPALRLASLTIRNKRIAQGRCVECGYDLRESRDRCPECGTPITAAE